MTTWKKFSQIFDSKTRKEINVNRWKATAWFGVAVCAAWKAICKHYDLGTQIQQATDMVLINRSGCVSQMEEAAKEIIKEHNLDI